MCVCALIFLGFEVLGHKERAHQQPPIEKQVTRTYESASSLHAGSDRIQRISRRAEKKIEKWKMRNGK